MEFKNLDLAGKLDNYLLSKRVVEKEEREEKYGKIRDKFFASDAGSCGRKIAYEFFGLKKKILDARTLRILENGNFLQRRYSKYFKEMGVWENEELSVNTADNEEIPFFLSARTDIIINYKKLFEDVFGKYEKENPELDDLALVELKSINTWGFKGKDGVGTGSPKLDHLYQLMIYMWLTGIHQGWILYEDKNEQDMVAIPVVYDERVLFGSGDERSKGLIAELEKLAEMIEQKIVPPRCPEANEEKFPCFWKRGQCDFYDHCWNPDHNGEAIPIVEEGEGIEIDGIWYDPNNITLEDLKKLKEKLIKAPVTATVETSESKTKKKEEKPVVTESTPEDSTTEKEKKIKRVTPEKSINCTNCDNIIKYKRAKNGCVTCKKCKFVVSVVDVKEGTLKAVKGGKS